MQRQRGELVPIGEVIGGLGGSLAYTSQNGLVST